MYRQEGDTLVSQEDKPDLTLSDAFDSLLSTLPDDCPIPTPIVKFGLLTKHLRPISDDFEVCIDDATIESSSRAIVPPKTLAAIEYFLYHHTDGLSKPDKQRIGQFCEVTELNRATQLGASDSAVKKAVEENDSNDYDFLAKTTYRCEHCDDAFDSKAARNGHLANCDENPELNESDTDQKSPSRSSSKDRPALGKEIRKDKGSERVSGRNPFADPDRIKDTGLHQGGSG
jgi:hypothetical protein